MILLVVTREARGSSGWQPKENSILFLSEWWGAGPHRVNLKFDNTVLNDAPYSTWYILGVIIIIIDTPVSFGINYRSEWERWRVACGSSFYTIIDWWFVNVDSINVHLWYHNGYIRMTNNCSINRPDGGHSDGTQPQIARFLGPTWGPPGSCWPLDGGREHGWWLFTTSQYTPETPFTNMV